jgi:cytochrome P450
MHLLFAGHETTVVQIGWDALLLLTNQVQWQALSDDPALIPNAVEELLLLDIGSANHDPAVIIDPDSVDVVRKHAAHLTFGYGAHYCIGAPLARIELKTVFTQLIPRFPSMQLTADPATLRVRRDVLAGGLSELPVSW